MASTITIRPWAGADLGILEANNAPEMTVYLGAPRPPRRWRDATR